MSVQQATTGVKFLRIENKVKIDPRAPNESRKSINRRFYSRISKIRAFEATRKFENRE